MNLIHSTKKPALFILIAYYGGWAWLKLVTQVIYDRLKVLLSTAINRLKLFFFPFLDGSKYVEPKSLCMVFHIIYSQASVSSGLAV